MIEIRTSIIAGVAFGILFGIILVNRYGLNHAIIVGPLAGLLFGIVIYFFVTSKIVKRQTQIELKGKTIIYAGGANHFLEGEAVGGKLYLLDDRLVFKSHGFNVQNHEQEILLNDIVDIKFYHTLDLVPNGLELITKDGHSEKFAVHHRKRWRREINGIK